MNEYNNMYLLSEDLFDPAMRALDLNRCRLRTYQTKALREIYDGALRHDGERFTVTYPRQSGKNETQAHLESGLMAANLHRGGTIIKLLPTEKNQGRISEDRLKNVLRAVPGKMVRPMKNEVRYGETRVRCLSASPNAAIVGATADLLLEVDEAQMVPQEKFDREALPMAASTNAAVVCWGTVWDDQTLLARESRHAETAENAGHAYRTTAVEVSQEVPGYADFVRSQVSLMGREHPTIRTQFFCEEISDLTGMFTPERIDAMQGSHAPLEGPEPDHCYVFLVDIAGSDEMTPAAKRAHGFSDRRDATVVTICDVSMPEGEPVNPKSYIWQVVARRLYRNVPAHQLEAYVSQEVERWNPIHIILDHTGLGCLLSDYLNRKYPYKCIARDITPAAKTRMAWEFLAMIDTGRWKDYHVDPAAALQSDYRPRRDRAEVLSEPVALRQMFIREMQACRMEPTADILTVRWGVKDGTRDPYTGRVIHDDLVMSAALCVFEETDLPIYNMTDAERETFRREEEEWEARRLRARWEKE